MSAQECADCSLSLDYEGDVPDDENEILCHECEKDRLRAERDTLKADIQHQDLKHLKEMASRMDEVEILRAELVKVAAEKEAALTALRQVAKGPWSYNGAPGPASIARKALGMPHDWKTSRGTWK